MNKVIYIYWAQKFENAPDVVKKCLLSWKIMNPTWKIVELNDENLSQYIDIEKDISHMKHKIKTKISYSDIVRIYLLEKYGGCWCDATVFCTQPLDDWLDKYISTGFFGFELKIDRMISSWFMYSEKNNYIITKWKDAVLKYLRAVRQLGTHHIHVSIDIWKWNKYDYQHYLWFHYLFSDLYQMDKQFKEMWDLTPKKSANDPLLLVFDGFMKPIPNQVKEHIDNLKSPMYKLTYKYDVNHYTNDSSLAYVLNSIDLSSYEIKNNNYNITSIPDSIGIGSYKVNTNNLGDHIQIIANLNLLKRHGLTPSVYIDRDNEVKNLNRQSYSFQKILLVMNGWHRRNNTQWPPNNRICPLFIGFHIRLKHCQYILNEESLEYFKKNEPIGCRDSYTKELLSKYGIESYESNCLTLTLDRYNVQSTGKIYVSSINKDIEKYIPSHISYQYINHYTNTNNFESNMSSAYTLLKKYSGAKLVITTFLHCALPCIGMGIPVIVFYPNSFDSVSESDKERFSGLDKLININTFKDIDKVNWNPEPVDISDIKSKLIEKYNEQLLSLTF